MTVQLKLFAVAKQLAGTPLIAIELPSGSTLGDLRRELLAAVPALVPLSAHLCFSLNSEYSSDATAIPPDAEIACIPPVSGG